VRNGKTPTSRRIVFFFAISNMAFIQKQKYMLKEFTWGPVRDKNAAQGGIFVPATPQVVFLAYISAFIYHSILLMAQCCQNKKILKKKIKVFSLIRRK